MTPEGSFRKLGSSEKSPSGVMHGRDNAAEVERVLIVVTLCLTGGARCFRMGCQPEAIALADHPKYKYPQMDTRGSNLFGLVMNLPFGDCTPPLKVAGNNPKF